MKLNLIMNKNVDANENMNLNVKNCGSGALTFAQPENNIASLSLARSITKLYCPLSSTTAAPRKICKYACSSGLNQMSQNILMRCAT